VKIQYLAHSAFYIECGGSRIMIDPFLSGNPLAPENAADLEVDYVLVSHAHGDHLGDAVQIAKKSGATVISMFEIATWCQGQGLDAHPLHIGGAYDFDFGRVKLTIAHHGSSMVGEDGSVTMLGTPCGFLIYTEGKTLYHSGDTGLFYDMKLIGEMNDISVAMLPIGGNFTMDEDDAVKAAEFLSPDIVIPMHFDTFDVIRADPNAFAEMLAKSGLDVTVLGPGQSMVL